MALVEARKAGRFRFEQRFEQLRGRVVFRESESLQMPSPVGFRFWPASEGWNVKHYASFRETQKEVGRLRNDISK